MKRYIKIIDGAIEYFHEPLTVGDQQIFNPTEEQILAAGWEEYTPNPIGEGQLTYKDRVAELIREKYTIEDEIAVIHQKSTNPDRWNEWYEYCEQCKQQVKAEFEQNNLAYD